MVYGAYFVNQNLLKCGKPILRFVHNRDFIGFCKPMARGKPVSARFAMTSRKEVGYGTE